MDRAAYDRYLTLFEARDYDAILGHFADRFDLEFAGYAFHAAPEVKAFYAFLHDYVRETVSVRRYVSDAATIALEADVRLEGIGDLTPEVAAAHGFPAIQPVAKGQVVTIPQFIHYHLDADGRIVAALCAISGPVRVEGAAA